MAILIVEDEFFIRTNLADVLRDDGFQVLEAGDADEAIQILEMNITIEVIITDVNMPGSMDGVGLVMAVQDRWPPIKSIITSGRDKPAGVPEGTLFFPKPVEYAVLTKAVRSFSQF